MNETHSLDDIIRALYDTISGPAGKERDWNRFRSLFFHGAHLVRTTIASDNTSQASVMEVESYIESTADYFRQQAFYEVEIARRVESFGNIAHVFSTYEARHDPKDSKPARRGVNSIQLFNDGSRWWVVNMLWDNERQGNPMPEEYLY